MKLLFLDVDGVLNHSKTPEWKTTKNVFGVLDAECISNLHKIILYTGARIVLSSTWRLSAKGCAAVEDEINLFDDLPTIIGKTPYPNPLTKSDQRKDEILAWLANVWPYSLGWNGKTITHMAVIDDDLDADLGDGSFFQTDFEAGGLTEEIADRIIFHLMKG